MARPASGSVAEHLDEVATLTYMTMIRPTKGNGAAA